MRTNDPDDAINQLYGEHDHALAQLEILRRTAGAMLRDGASAEMLSDYRKALGFLEHEVRAHNQWEEDHLFPLIERYVGPGGPCAVMRAEHRRLWDIYDEIGNILKMNEGLALDAAAVNDLAELAGAIVGLLGAHIEKENQILFPLARRMLRPDDVQKLAAAR